MGSGKVNASILLTLHQMINLFWATYKLLPTNFNGKEAGRGDLTPALLYPLR